MKRCKIFLSVSVLIFSFQINIIQAQKEINHWYFGKYAGIDFSSGVAVADTNGQVWTDEGTASVSDSNGDLLFYTNGFKVYNKNHFEMPNGGFLWGHPSTTQTLIVRKPGSNRYYYIFTAPYQGNAGVGLRYSQVDMNLNGGLGDVTPSMLNIPIYTPTCEKMVGIQHCNNQDVWLVTHEYNSDAFRSYLITSSGINTTPIISNVGLFIPIHPSGWTAIGQLKASADGKKLASANMALNNFELFDFNISTGVVSNSILFPQYTATEGQGAYGVEFSPDGTKLYGTTVKPGKLYQFDLCAGNNTDISNSGILIDTSSRSFGALQLGPDKKIYLAREYGDSLGVINKPNILGIGCSYIDNGLYLSGRSSMLGLPNFISDFLKPPIPPFTFVPNCLNLLFTVPTLNNTNCAGSTNAITSFFWNFGDTNSGLNDTSTMNNPIHNFSSAGTYNVSLVLNSLCNSDTLIQSIIVSDSFDLNLTTTAVKTDCDTANGIITASLGKGTAPYSYLWNNGNTNSVISGLSTGTYTVSVTDVNGCNQITTNDIIPKTGTADAGMDLNIKANSFAQLNAIGGIIYNWSPSDGLSCDTCQNPTASPLQTITYKVTVTDTYGCIASDDVVVSIDCGEIFVPNIFSPNNDGQNDLECVFGNCVESISFMIFDRWGEKVFETNDKIQCWDGTYKGKPLDNAVFVYYLTATIAGEEISKKGNISLVR